MFERSVPILRMICLALAALIVVQVSRLAAQKDPLRDVKIPTMAAASSVSSNILTISNTLANSNRPTISNSLTTSNVLTRSNAVTKPANLTNAPGTNSLAQASGKNETNSAPRLVSAMNPMSSMPRQAPEGMRGGPVPGGPGQAMPALPQAIQMRVDKITQSEILGPVIRPQPMALLGIAGRDAFLRTPVGQTGLLREGEELGGVKLLSIGTNRVLIEHEGQKKELMIFSGFGSETLLPKGKQNPQ